VSLITRQCINSIDQGRFYCQINHTDELCAYDLYAVLLRFVFTMRTMHDFMTRVSTEVLYITSLSLSDTSNRGCNVLTSNTLLNIIYRRVYTHRSKLEAI